MSTTTARPPTGRPGRRRHPFVNAFVVWLLRSPVHGVLDPGLCELRYHGRLTHRQLSVPVLYAAEGERFVVIAGDADRKMWWRNFSSPYPVEVRRGGESRHGMGRVIGPGDPGYADILAIYQRRHDIAIQSTDRVLLIETPAIP
jgi:hypothetical protein